MTTVVQFRNKREKTAFRRRKQIFDTAVHLFIQKGVVNTSMREIAEAVGITIGGLYHYVKSKDEIVRMVTQNSMHAHKSVKNLRKSLGDVSPTEAFRVCVKSWITVAESGIEPTAFIDREKMHMEPDVQQLVSDTALDLIQFFEDLLNDGIRAGEFEVDNVTLTAFNTYMLRALFATRQWFLNDRFTAEEYATQETNAILKQILIDRSKI